MSKHRFRDIASDSVFRKVGQPDVYRRTGQRNATREGDGALWCDIDPQTVVETISGKTFLSNDCLERIAILKRNERRSFVARHWDDIGYLVFAAAIAGGVLTVHNGAALITAGVLGLVYIIVAAAGHHTYGSTGSSPRRTPREPAGESESPAE